VFLTSLVLTVGIFVCPQGLRNFKLSWPPVPEDAAGRTARRLAAEKDKETKDAEKARARERMRAQEALEKHRRRQARDGLPLEPSPDTPDDDDDDDDEDDDMAARLGLRPDPRLGQRLLSQLPGGLASPTFGAGTPGSRSKEWRRAEGALDPLAKIIRVTPGGQAKPHVPQEKVLVPAVREVGPPAVVTSPGQAAPSAPRASEMEAALKPAARTTLGSACRDWGPRGLPAGMIGLAPERVSIRGYPCFSYFVVCLEFAPSPFQQAEAGLGWSGPHKDP
jgi:hypothetical protein